MPKRNPASTAACSITQHITLPKIKVLSCQRGHLAQNLKGSTERAFIPRLLQSYYSQLMEPSDSLLPLSSGQQTALYAQKQAQKHCSDKAKDPL